MAKASHQSEVSKRYARALYNAVEASGTDKALAQLRSVRDLLFHDKVRNLACSPILSKKERVEIIEKLCSTLSLDKDVLAFIKVLAAKGRLSIFEEVVNSFEFLCDEKNKVLRGFVKSKEELSSSERSEIEKAIRDFTGAQLILEYSQDPKMIGGVFAQVGSYTFDGSLDTQLRKLKEQVTNRI
jgi:F-type H+-transporting ATPase subunit delta